MRSPSSPTTWAPPRRAWRRSSITWDEGAERQALDRPTSSPQLERPPQKPGVVGATGGRRRQGHGGRRARRSRPIYQHAVPRARDHGADELHRACAQGRLRRLGRHAGRRPRPGDAPPRSPACRSEKVAVHNHLLGGGFGRRLEVDCVTQAVQHRQAGRRSGEGRLDPRGGHPARHLPAVSTTTGSPPGSTRRASRWPGSHRVVGSSIIARWLPPAFKNGLDFDAVDGAAGPYDFANLPCRLCPRRSRRRA